MKKYEQPKLMIIFFQNNIHAGNDAGASLVPTLKEATLSQQVITRIYSKDFQEIILFN